ncbi:SusC/RagA family TonB-linked outer membrane protein [Spirosoma fluviale]|uniref:TonB-linked outer membrane protein, SusC/RagA family n=1 Tax=Spirosoma fluviale TaxID=1597977 RepID=A0A286GCB6_9BACT|nr:TonB-dependent receptor [Spirosoma fluviale]SOD93167.1 TonB-linked outer membrane protein, SusC/RagA family [Spirosoma fluviale]
MQYKKRLQPKSSKLLNAFRTLMVVWLFAIATPSLAQQVSGTVTNEAGEPLPGVNVVEKGTVRGATTDKNGKYSIAAGRQATLVFSFIGYTKQEVAVGNRSVIDVKMNTDPLALNEVIVVGYGTQKKSSLTGAVSSVSPKDLRALPVISPVQALQGRVPGVSVTNNSSPGSEPVVRVRGVGSISLNPNPLYVIDGIPAGGLNNIDPKDIESLEVLKDASAAAIYGSRAANGVILITTKKGATNGKLTINVDSYYGSQSAWRKLDLLNSQEYINYGTSLLTAAGQPVPGRFANMNVPIYDGATQTFAQTDTDWQDVMFRAAPIMDHQISLSGGNATSRFYTSLGYFKQDGILPFTNYDRQSFRINSDHKVSKYLTIGQTMLASTDFRRLERDGGGRSLLMNIMRMTPYWPVRDPTKIGGFSTTAQGLDATDPENPLRVAEQEQQFQTDRGFKLLGSIFAEVKFTDFLRYRFTFGADYANARFNGFLPIYNDGNRSRVIANVNENRSEFFSSVMTNQLTFEKTYGKHFVNLTGVAEQQRSMSRSISASGQRPDNNIQVIQGVSNPNGSSTLNENLLISYVGRLNYEYAGRYLLGASIRRDGSSKFAPGRKWGTFPAVSAGWRISEEKFMKGVSAFSELKLRGSYGQTGYNAIGDYDWQPLIQANNTIYPFGNQTQLGSFFNQLGNSDLSWEVTTMSNVGVDASLFNNKINLSAEVYSRQTEGLLLRVPLPESQGYSVNPLANVGSMRNQGFELTAGYNYSSKNFNWNLTGTFDITRNKVLSLATPNATINSGSNADFGGFDITRTEVGQPIQSFYGWVVDGIFQSQGELDRYNSIDGNASTFYQNDKTAPGDIRFRDLNGDGRIDANDRQYLGSFIPKFSYGLNWTGTYKNFDFTVFFQGVQGNKVYNGTKVIGQGQLRLFNATADVLNAWTPQNTNTDVPRSISGDPNQNSRTSDRFLEDGSYLRLKNMSIGYTIPASVIGKLTGNVLSKTRVYVSSQNLLTFTKYTGYDPEVSSKNYNLLNNGIDYVQYPQARTIMVGVNLGF